MTADVVVVGGGLAGLATATSLARRGVSVTVLDAGTWPRTTMCGEFLSPDAERALDGIGAADAVSRLHAPWIRAVRVTVSGGGRLRADATSTLPVPGRGVSRWDLDARVAEAARAAGVVLVEHARVVSLDPAASQVTASWAGGCVSARVAVVATGRVPGLGRGHAAPARRWVAVKMHVRGVRAAGVTELHFVRGAYVGVNEVVCAGEHVVNVCALARRDAWERAGARPEGMWELLSRESLAFAARMRRAVRVDGSEVAAAGFAFSRRLAFGEGERSPFFVGDAAALIAPWCGDGQAMALTGGASLGDILAGCRLEDADDVARAAAAWDEQLRRRFRGRLLLGRALQTVLLRPRAAAPLVRSFADRPAVSDWVYLGTRGRLGVRAS